MKLLLDMNLSPAWSAHLSQAGHNVLHWLDVGQPDAADAVILEWARQSGRVIVTADLDFGAMLTAMGSAQPSVVQIRTETTAVSRIGSVVTEALDRAAAELEGGAIVTVEDSRVRIRLLRQDQ